MSSSVLPYWFVSCTAGCVCAWTNKWWWWWYLYYSCCKLCYCNCRILLHEKVSIQSRRRRWCPLGSSRTRRDPGSSVCPHTAPRNRPHQARLSLIYTDRGPIRMPHLAFCVDEHMPANTRLTFAHQINCLWYILKIAVLQQIQIQVCTATARLTDCPGMLMSVSMPNGIDVLSLILLGREFQAAEPAWLKQRLVYQIAHECGVWCSQQCPDLRPGLRLDSAIDCTESVKYCGARPVWIWCINVHYLYVSCKLHILVYRSKEQRHPNGKNGLDLERMKEERI